MVAWMGKAVDVTDFTDGDHRSDGLITFKPHEGEHDGLHVPLVEQGFHVHLQPLDALGCGINALQILLQHDLHGGVRQDQFTQVTHIAPRSARSFHHSGSVAQQEALG
ncbi:MAG: hypothetical protein U1F71_05320 [Verrucomicrobiaceae bacterium]